MRKTALTILAVASTLVLSGTVPVRADVDTTFDLDNVTFSDGGTATGSFVFDSTTLALSTVSITTSLEESFGATYTSGSFTGNEFDFSIPGGLLLQLSAAPPLSLTSPNSILTGIEGLPGINETARFVVSGSLDPVPLPATLPLFATGLGALGLLGWRRKRKTRVSLLGAA